MNLAAHSESGFVYLQIGAHGSFSAYDNDISYKPMFGDGWKIYITEPDPEKFRYLEMHYNGYTEKTFLNIGICSNTATKHHSVDFISTIEEIEAESGIFEEMTYDLFIGPNFEGNFSTLPEAHSHRANFQQVIDANPWLTRVSSYNFSSLLSSRHLEILPALANYTRETVPLVTKTPIELISQLSLSKIDLLHIAQSGDDYDIVKNFPFETIQPRFLAFKILHMSNAQLTEIENLLISTGYVRDDTWLLDSMHVGYTKLL